MTVKCDITFYDVVSAYYRCRKSKRKSYSSLEFEMDLESNLFQLYTDLITGNYKIGRSICFVVKYPRPREVWAAQFRDRIVHHLIYELVSPQVYSSMIYHTYACIPNKGTHKGVKDLERMVRSVSNNFSEKAYFLKCDLSNFFMSIDKNIIFNIVNKYVHEFWLSELLYEVLFNDPLDNPIINSSRSEFLIIPERKRLVNAKPLFGIPIGNLTSQLLANLLLDVLDKFIKHTLKVKYYVRYMDDFIILSGSKDYLVNIVGDIKKLCRDINTNLNPKKVFIQGIDRGIPFLGQIIRPYHSTLQRNVIQRIVSQKSLKPFSNYHSVLIAPKNHFRSYEAMRRRYQCH